MISSPPVLYPDFYGINTPDQADLIAAHMSLEEMRVYLGADTLNFLSIDGMVRATGLSRDQLSLSCFDGVYPIAIGHRGEGVVLAGSLRTEGARGSMPDAFRLDSRPTRLTV
jgi:amidophosphoribosyltransferase